MSKDEFDQLGEENFTEEWSEDESTELMEALESDESEEEVTADIEGETEEVIPEGSELEGYESAEVEMVEFLEADRVASILESILFSTDRPQSIALMKQAFKGTNVKTKEIKEALELLNRTYASADRGIVLEEVNSGYQLRTKVDNMNYLRQMVKARPFKLSGPALEVLSIVAYKQPCIKSDVDQIRGVESGHLLRGLMERGLVTFAGKSDLPGKPMLYGTTRKFLEIFGLRNIKELPSLGEIDELIPEGIGEVEEKESRLDELTESMSKEVGQTYSEGEEELLKITDELDVISTTTEFFEREKQRQKEQRDADRARDIREALLVGEEVPDKDRRWLQKYELQLEGPQIPAASEESTTSTESEIVSETEVTAEPSVDESSELLEATRERDPEVNL